jgi:hypothetical protein
MVVPIRGSFEMASSTKPETVPRLESAGMVPAVSAVPNRRPVIQMVAMKPIRWRVNDEMSIETRQIRQGRYEVISSLLFGYE